VPQTNYTSFNPTTAQSTTNNHLSLSDVPPTTQPFKQEKCNTKSKIEV
jgi:hypothetical protein